jgi:hypothetical protein
LDIGEKDEKNFVLPGAIVDYCHIYGNVPE